MALRGQCVREFQKHKKVVHAVAWNSNGTRLASGSVDSTAIVWTGLADESGGNVGHVELRGHQEGVDQLCWDPQHPDRLATASGDKTVRLWDVRTGRCTNVIETRGENINIAWSPDHHIAVGNKDDDVSIIDVRKGKMLKTTRLPYEVNEMSWSLDGSLFFLTTGMGTIEVLRYADFLRGGKAESFRSLSVSRRPSARAHKPTLTLRIRRGRRALRSCVARMPVGVHSHRYARRPACALRPARSRPLRSQGHTANCYCLQFSPSGDCFAVGGADALVSVWSMPELVCVRTLTRLEWPVRTISFSHDGRLLASASEDTYIDIADAETGEQVHAIATKVAMNSIAWHPSQLLLAYAGDDKDRDEGMFRVFGYHA
jgi:THO complex subunit 3